MNLEAEPWNVDGTILHVGAGQCRELDRYLAAEARHIVLVEPNRDKQRVLRARTDADSRVHVSSMALAAEDAREVALNIYNVESFNSVEGSLRSTSGYPGLHVLEQRTVPAWSPQTLFRKVSKPAGLRSCLIVEAPGQVRRLVEALGTEELQDIFVNLLVRVSRSGSFGETPRQVIAAMASSGYRVTEVSDGGADLLLSAEVDEHWAELRAQHTESEASQRRSEEAEELRAALEERDKRLTDLTRQNEELRAENRRREAAEQDRARNQALLREELTRAEMQLDMLEQLISARVSTAEQDQPAQTAPGK